MRCKCTQIKVTNFFELKTVNIFFPINLNRFWECSNELSHQDGSFEYPQNILKLRNKKKFMHILARGMDIWIFRVNTVKMDIIILSYYLNVICLIFIHVQ